MSRRSGHKAVLVGLLLAFSTSGSTSSQNPRVAKEDRAFYVLFPDSSKAYIVQDHGCGARNVAVLSPDSRYVFYSDCTGIGFESSGKDLFYCKPDGTERTFIHKIYGYANDVSWVQKNGHDYVVFLEVYAGEGEAFLDVFDFDDREMILRTKAWGLRRKAETDCFETQEELRVPPVWSTICLDSLLTLGDPDKHHVRVHEGYVYPNVVYLSVRRESFLNPDVYWYEIPEYAETYYGGLGQCFPSPHRWRTAYCVNMDSRSWVGVLNNKTMRFQYTDSMTVGEYKQNFAWSDCERYLALVKTLQGREQQITVLEFLGDSSCTIREEIRFKEEKEIELLGWSTRRGGFEYMLGDKEFLEIR